MAEGLKRDAAVIGKVMMLAAAVEQNSIEAATLGVALVEGGAIYLRESGNMFAEIGGVQSTMACSLFNRIIWNYTVNLEFTNINL